MVSGLIDGDFRALPSRGLSQEACRKFGVRVGRLGQEVVLAMDYRDQDGNLTAQKVKTPAKDFRILGDSKSMGLFGQHLWSGGGSRVVVTEGELDCVAMCQLMDLRWPVVSVPNGASNAKKDVAKAMDWLLGFEEVVLAFDADEPGRAATADVAALFPPGRVRVAEMPPGCKDPNDALLKNCEREMIAAVRFNARPWRPDGIVQVSDIMERILTAPAMGSPYPFQGITDATYGRLAGELIGLGGGTGCGKTDLFTTMVDYDTRVLGVPTGVLSLEQPVEETARRIAGKAVGREFHIPDGRWTPEDLSKAVGELSGRPLFLYDSFGVMDWETVSSRIRYMAQVDGCRHIYLDHLTAMAAGVDDERKALEKIMAEASGLAQNLKIVLHFVSHLTTPEGGPSHEEGGRVTIRQFKGSRAIGFWSHVLWGLERNQQDADESERCVTVLRCLKYRRIGRVVGQTFRLRFDLDTGILGEDQGSKEAASAGF